MRSVEFTGTAAFVTPIEQEFPAGRELRYAAVAIAVTDIDAVVGSERDSGRGIEVRAIQTGGTRYTQREQRLSIIGELEHLLQRRVGNPDVIVVIHTKAMRVYKAIFPPSSKLPAGFSIKTEDRRRGDGAGLPCWGRWRTSRFP